MSVFGRYPCDHTHNQSLRLSIRWLKKLFRRNKMRRFEQVQDIKALVPKKSLYNFAEILTALLTMLSSYVRIA